MLKLTLLSLAVVSLALLGPEKKEAPVKERLFEMRTYIASPGKLEALHARFRNHTSKLFEKHGMTLVGYFTPTEGEAAKDTLIYILAYPDREAQKKAWKGFTEDPEWRKAKKDSEADGALVKEAKSVFLKPTGYSPLR